MRAVRQQPIHIDTMHAERERRARGLCDLSMECRMALTRAWMAARSRMLAARSERPEGRQTKKASTASDERKRQIDCGMLPLIFLRSNTEQEGAPFPPAGADGGCQGFAGPVPSTLLDEQSSMSKPLSCYETCRLPVKETASSGVILHNFFHWKRFFLAARLLRSARRGRENGSGRSAFATHRPGRLSRKSRDNPAGARRTGRRRGAARRRVHSSAPYPARARCAGRCVPDAEC